MPAFVDAGTLGADPHAAPAPFAYNSRMTSPAKRTLEALHHELHEVFGARLRSLVVYGPHIGHASGGDLEAALHDLPDPVFERGAGVHTLVLVDALTADDLAACAARSPGWHDRGLATPLLLSADELGRSLDAFPLEFAEIAAHHAVVAGADPFTAVTIDPADVRRACEVQVRSHLLHLREGYVEASGRPDSIASLIAASAAPFKALLVNIGRLRGLGAQHTSDNLARHADEIGLPGEIIRRVTTIARPGDLAPAEAVRLFPAYLDAVEQLSRFVDRWTV